MHHETITDLEELGNRSGASHSMEKVSLGVDALPHEIEELFHAIEMIALRQLRFRSGQHEVINIVSQVSQGR